MEGIVMEEIELRELIEILIKGKKLIAIITIAAILVAGVYSFLILKPTYKAQMVLMTSNLGNVDKNTNIDPSSVDKLLDAMSQLPSMNLETYRQQIKSPEVISKTIEDLNLQDKYSVSGLASRIELETIDNTQMITIRMESGDPEEAAEIVNKLGENFTAFVSEKTLESANKSFDYIKNQMEIEKQKYEEALLELGEVLSRPRGAQELELELKSSFEQITLYKSNLNDLEIKKASLEKAIEESSKYSSNRGSMVVRPNLGESFNISFDDTNKVLKVDLAETEGRIESTKKQIAQLQEHIEELQLEYQDKKFEEDIVKQKVDINKQTYESFVAKYEELRVRETAKVGELSISVVSYAYPPTSPSGPNKTLNLAIATILGLMVGVFVTFFKAYWESSTKEELPDGGSANN
jgi:succinoglycan biosynthesis transport protein ExoP